MSTSNKGCLTKFKTTALWGVLIFGLLLSGIAIINIRFSDSSDPVDTLGQAELIRLQEIDHLRSVVGDQIWPGFAEQQIPIILYNEAYVFLIGMSDPEPGWKKVPFTKQMGSKWSIVEADAALSYYRQPLFSSEQIPEAFTVQINDLYVASMTTKEWTKIKLTQLIKADLPGFLKPIFPYALLRAKFNSDWHISAIIHEAFHAFQADNVFERVRSAEASNTYEANYPWKNHDFREAWLSERLVLGNILKTKDDQKFRKLTKEWLQIREERRKTFSNTKLITYEQEREWLEGLAKYAEIRSWVLASDPELYEPLPKMTADTDFDNYHDGFKNRNREIKQLQSDLNFSETIFYYSGWAQAEILDRLDSGWKEKAFEPNIYLDDLIRNILEPQAFVGTR